MEAEQRPTTAERPAWVTSSKPGELPCHTLIIAGVLCRWWGDKEPPGVKLIAAVNQAPLVEELVGALEWAHDRIHVPEEGVAFSCLPTCPCHRVLLRIRKAQEQGA